MPTVRHAASNRAMAAAASAIREGRRRRMAPESRRSARSWSRDLTPIAGFCHEGGGSRHLYIWANRADLPSRSGELLHPRDVFVHPAVQKLSSVGIGEIARFVEKSVFEVQIDFRLRKSRHVQIRENAPQVSLCDGRPDTADRNSDDSRGLASPGVLTVRT